MVRLRALLLATLLLLSAPAVSVGGVAPEPAATDSSSLQQSSPANTSSLLELDEVEASNRTSPEASLATELSMQGSELDGRFAEYEAETRLANLNGEAEVRFALNETARLQAELDRMLAMEEQARQRYIAGEISAEAYVRTLARLNVQARTIRPTVNSLDDVGGEEVTRRLGLVESDLPILSGPILERTSSIVRGEEQPMTIHVISSANGVVLSEVDDGTYVRETYRADRVNKEGLHLSLGEAEDKLRSWYPWAVGPNFGAHAIRFGPAAWEMSWTHEHASISTYYYGNTTGPYREIQRKTLSEYPFESTEQTFDNDRILSVSGTYPGGPLEVNLTNQTGAPLDGEVLVNGSETGRTGDDGLLWALQPEGSFTVTVVHEGERIEIDLAATDAEFGDATGDRADVTGR